MKFVASKLQLLRLRRTLRQNRAGLELTLATGVGVERAAGEYVRSVTQYRVALFAELNQEFSRPRAIRTFPRMLKTA